MKKYINLSLFAILAVFICFSCKSKDVQTTEKRVIVIELKDKYDEEYISTEYETYKPLKVKRSNRTLNQFKSTFSLDDVFYKGLINRLNNDPNVIKVIEMNSSKVDKPINSTNQQKSTAKPVIK